MRIAARLAATLTIVTIAGAGDAAAQGVRLIQLRGLLASCLGDYQRLCPGIPPGGGRIVVCLNAQAEKLSQSCFQAMAERGLATAAALRLCQADFDSLCPGVPAGQGRALACLLGKRDRLSAGCSRALSAHGLNVEPE